MPAPWFLVVSVTLTCGPAAPDKEIVVGKIVIDETIRSGLSLMGTARVLFASLVSGTAPPSSATAMM